MMKLKGEEHKSDTKPGLCFCTEIHFKKHLLDCTATAIQHEMLGSLTGRKLDSREPQPRSILAMHFPELL